MPKLFAAGDIVTVPTTRYKKGQPHTVRVKAVITDIRKSNNRTVAAIIYRSGRLAGMFGFADITECKKPRTRAAREYRFGKLVTD